MESYKARVLAFELMSKHNLISNGWSFEFDNGKRRLGCCKYRVKRISFSKHYLPLADINEFTNTLLHEIAHVLVGGGHGHDLVWQRKAIEIGCNGKRVYQGEMKLVGKYYAVCPKCGKKHYKHRKTTTSQSCGFCSGGRFNRESILIFIETI